MFFNAKEKMVVIMALCENRYMSVFRTHFNILREEMTVCPVGG